MVRLRRRFCLRLPAGHGVSERRRLVSRRLTPGRSGFDSGRSSPTAKPLRSRCRCATVACVSGRRSTSNARGVAVMRRLVHVDTAVLFLLRLRHFVPPLRMTRELRDVLSAAFLPAVARRRRRCRGPCSVARSPARRPRRGSRQTPRSSRSGRRGELGVRRRVIGNQVHVVEMPAHQLCERARARRVVVDAREHDVLEEDLAVASWRRIARTPPSACASGKRRLTGMNLERSSSVGACSEIARLTCRCSSANASILSTSPTVEIVMWRWPRPKPCGSFSSATASITAS